MLLKNGFLINPKTHTQELTDIRILNGKISQISAGPVSYTHLTLPTKLEV